LGQKYLYFFELEIVGKHDRKNIEKHWKGPIFLEKQQCTPQKNIMDTININVLVGKSHILQLMKVKMIS
jgi:hypothetical protein